MALQTPITCNNVSWKIDFKISVRDRTDSQLQIRLADTANRINGANFSSLSSIYFEYKGLMDKNFKGKMSNLMSNSPMLAQTIVLVGSEVSAFADYNLARQKFILHPVISTGLLAYLLNH
jgi:hypothetical protein